MHYNELRSRTSKLDVLKESGKSHVWPYLRATKWRCDWTLDVLSQLLHTRAIPYMQLVHYWTVDC